MKISVVIPVYNEEKYIHQCLSSLKNQVVQPYEIIVVDNNCKDKTIEIAKRFSVKIIKETKQGISYARTKGYNSAKGEIIARCDADTILSSNWIRIIDYNFTKNKSISGLIGALSFYDYDLRLKDPLHILDTINEYIFKIYIFTMKKLIGQYPFNGPNMAISKKAWNKVKDTACLDDKQFHEDIDLSIHVIKSGGKIIYDSKMIAQFSARRMKNDPESFFKEYPNRAIKTINMHYPRSIESTFLLLNAKLFTQVVHSVYNLLNSSKLVTSLGNLSSLKRSRRGKRKASPEL